MLQMLDEIQCTVHDRTCTGHIRVTEHGYGPFTHRTLLCLKMLGEHMDPLHIFKKNYPILTGCTNKYFIK